MANLRELGNPLEFLYLDHLQEREICAVLDRISNALAVDPDDVSDVLAFLREVLPFHLADEEEDLFPLLRKRCEAEDEIDKAIHRLLSDHSHAAEDTPDVITILERHAAGGCELEEGERMALKQYASHARRHLVLENAIILPIAKLRLNEEDLDRLRHGMLERRGLGRLWDSPHTG
ncbi:hemerythrin domain-containing protein [Aliiroseovarius subalbicans]|uniref:hemerythrin domain-containing protein n=1 Tax=Aliiroseovarius subalbicans TaxID=2925840 RepID=UPI001F577C0F|nr:hemerythrin domain-containing protein [Aliiroseovarius subalbicans]MCI2399615.1 hemerythrin domain-containing protein [Aliiroseovarius subalbicans]